MPSTVLKYVYYAHIYPHLNFWYPIWSINYPCHLHQLNVFHKKIVRILSDSEYYAHTPPLFKALKIFNLRDLSKLNVVSYMYKQIDSHNTSRTLHNYQTQHQHSQNIPNHRLTQFQHSLMYQGPKTWNAIPINIKNSSSLNSF